MNREYQRLSEIIHPKTMPFVKWAKPPGHSVSVPWVPREVLIDLRSNCACHVVPLILNGRELRWRRVAAKITGNRAIADSLDYVDYRSFAEAVKPSNEAVHAFASILAMKDVPQVRLLRSTTP